MKRPILLMLAAISLSSGLATPRAAKAGLLYEGIDVFYITPFLGAEIARLRFAGLSETGGIETGGFNMAGFAYGAHGGVRFGPMRFAVLYQRADGRNSENELTVGLNKLYGEFALNIPFGDIVGVFHIDFGWAFLQTQGATLQGFGGKLGAALDWYPMRWLSVGIAAHFDVQGYKTSSGIIAGYGGTFLGTVGFHF